MKEFKSYQGIINYQPTRYRGILGLIDNIREDCFDSISHNFGNQFHNDIT